MRENRGMLGFGTYKLLPTGLMQVKQEITTAGQESHSKVCHPMNQSSPAIQLRPSEKDAASKHALASPHWAVVAVTVYTSGQKAWLTCLEPRAERLNGHDCLALLLYCLHR